MLKKSMVICLVLQLLSWPLFAQDIATLEVTIPKDHQGLIIPTNTNLDQITHLPDSALSLYLKSGKNEVEVPMQIDHVGNRQMYWIVDPGQVKGKKAVYILRNKPAGKTQVVQSIDKGGKLTIQTGDQKLVSYQYETVYPPDGINPAYQRSGFIHPLYAPNGQVLTRIQPPDHYHHYGIWNPWTHVKYKNDTLDFWNLAKKQATVRFADFTSINDGPVFSQYQALHEHVVLKDGSNEVAMKEIQSIRVYQPQNDAESPYYILDMTVNLNCATSEPVTLLEYRYAGFGWRTTEKWDNQNSMVLSSTGKDRAATDGSKERWCIVQGALDEDYGGAVLMSHPTNYNHPEPMRIWPVNQYDRGDMFASFTTTKDMDWVLNPKTQNVLRYRMIVYNNKFTKEMAEQGWQSFAAIPEIKITKK